MKPTAISYNRFYLFVAVISLAGFLLRCVNTDYASFNADELYSMLSVHPGNSWYEILYMQRTYQPPAYFMLLWGWTELFGYTEFSARFLSVLGGTFAIVLSALFGKKIQGNRLGLFLAFLVAFNPMQIAYSIEARFYIFTYCVAVMALWLHWHLLWNRSSTYFIFIILAGINAALCYFHQFGIFFVFGLFLHDLWVARKEGDKNYLVKKLGVYVLAALCYAPWFFWGILQGLATTNFWLKEINIWQYFTFSLSYSTAINLLLCGFIGYYLLRMSDKNVRFGSLFLVIVFTVVAIPLLYSFIRIPILVDRYSMVMTPAIYVMLGLALIDVYDRIKLFQLRLVGSIALLFAFSYAGFNLSVVDRENRLHKQPWREMGAWLKKQPDLKEANVYANGILLKNRFTIDFYIEPDKKAIPLYTINLGKDRKMYLVESSYVWSIDPELLKKVKKDYVVDVVPFHTDKTDFGRIYICTRKRQTIPVPQNTAHAF